MQISAFDTRGHFLQTRTPGAVTLPLPSYKPVRQAMNNDQHDHIIDNSGVSRKPGNRSIQNQTMKNDFPQIFKHSDEWCDDRLFSLSRSATGKRHR